MKHELEQLVTAQLEQLGYDLVELRVGGSRIRPVLDIRIDRKDGQRVAIGDCERISRSLEATLDTMPGAPDGQQALVAPRGRYVLEVSSPGLERPLRTLGDWRRFAGRRANVRSTQLAALGGRAEVEIVGVSDGGSAGEQIVVRDRTGKEHSMGLADVAEARLAFHWNP